VIIVHYISSKQTIFELVQAYPELKEILKSIGFERITDPLMINTVGKFMTLESGSKMKNIDIAMIQETLFNYGFTLEVTK
jgi:hypothetical protein